MLVLSRNRDESIMIGDDVVVTVVDIRRDKVRLGIAAPVEVPVHRDEVYEAIRRQEASRPVPVAAVIRYRDHRGEVADRRILPGRVYYGSARWHPDDQWLLDAVDLDKGAIRTFALANISAWDPAPGAKGGAA